MINKELNPLIEANPKHLSKIAIYFYNQLAKLDDDPISYEITFNKYSLKDKEIKIDNFDFFILNLKKLFNQINYDVEKKHLTILPIDYDKIVKLFKISLEELEKIANINDNKIKFNEQIIDIEIETKFNKLFKILKTMYMTATQGHKMTMVHVFGIKYDKELEELEKLGIKKYSVKNLVIKCTNTDKKALHVEVGKGRKLSKFVKELDWEKVEEYYNHKELEKLTSENKNDKL